MEHIPTRKHIWILSVLGPNMSAAISYEFRMLKPWRAQLRIHIPTHHTHTLTHSHHCKQTSSSEVPWWNDDFADAESAQVSTVNDDGLVSEVGN